MIPRYSLSPMRELFGDVARMSRWLEVEVLTVEALAAIGVAPSAAAAACRARAPRVDDDFVAAVLERERVTDHDVAAFVDVVQQRIGGDEAVWIHYGLTSTDVVDTAQGAQLADAAVVLDDAAAGLVAVLVRRAREHAATVTIGRTHGIHAEPTTFGAKLALWALQVDRDRERLAHAYRSIAVGKLSGAVGTFSNIDPAVEARVCAAMGLVAVPATQVVARDRHAELLYACASLGATVEAIALEVRHLQRTEVREVREGFAAGKQKGSSAMPHKRNPITAERLCGLARVLRGHLVAGLENVALWHERDISHSSVERIVLPDALLLTHYVCVTAARLVDRLEVDVERMRANLDLTRGLVCSQSVLLALVRAGSTRDDAYRVVQELAERSWTEGIALRALLAEDPRVGLDDAQLDACFDITHQLRHAGRFIDALAGVEDRPALQRRPVELPPA